MKIEKPNFRKIFPQRIGFSFECHHLPDSPEGLRFVVNDEEVDPNILNIACMSNSIQVIRDYLKDNRELKSSLIKRHFHTTVRLENLMIELMEKYSESKTKTNLNNN